MAGDSTFLTRPPELRTSVYRDYFPHDIKVTYVAASISSTKSAILGFTGPPRRNEWALKPQSLALLAACKIINREATDFYLKNSTFRFSLPQKYNLGPYYVPAFRSTQITRTGRSISNVVVEIQSDTRRTTATSTIQRLINKRVARRSFTLDVRRSQPTSMSTDLSILQYIKHVTTYQEVVILLSCSRWTKHSCTQSVLMREMCMSVCSNT